MNIYYTRDGMRAVHESGVETITTIEQLREIEAGLVEESHDLQARLDDIQAKIANCLDA